MSIRGKSILERAVLYCLIIVLLTGHYLVWKWDNDQKKNLVEIESETKKTQQKINQIVSTKNTLKQKISEMKNLPEELNKLRNQVKNTLPLQENLPQLVEDIHRIAKNQQVEILSGNYNRPETSLLRDYREMDFSMSIYGSYSNVKNFFGEVEGMNWKVNIEKLRIRELYDEKGMMSADIVIRTYIIGATT